jgi:hypothetical protein
MRKERILFDLMSERVTSKAPRVPTRTDRVEAQKAASVVFFKARIDAGDVRTSFTKGGFPFTERNTSARSLPNGYAVITTR